MKDSTVAIISGLVVVGVATYGVYKYIHRQNGTAGVKDDSPNSDFKSASSQVEDRAVTSSHINDLSRTKKEAVSSFKEVREQAAQTIEESLNTIFNDSSMDIVTENTEILNKISTDLDDLLE